MTLSFIMEFSFVVVVELSFLNIWILMLAVVLGCCLLCFIVTVTDALINALTGMLSYTLTHHLGITRTQTTKSGT
jgi:hypothetical protein